MMFQVSHSRDASFIFIEKEHLFGKDNEIFQEIIRDSINHGSKNICVDLKMVKFITSWGIESFIHAYKLCKENNIDFSLKNVNASVLNVLTTLKLTDIIKVD